MERAPRRGRNRLVSGAAEPRAGQPAAHREPLFLASEPWGPTHSHSRTWPSPGPAPRHPRALQHPATHWQNRKRRKKKLGNGPSLPSLTLYSQQHTQHEYSPAPLPPWQVKLPGCSECSGEESLPLPFSNTPSSHSHVQGAV